MAQYHLRYVDSTACYLIRMGNAVSDSHPALPRSRRKSTLYFAAAGVLAGGLPLIHTHSFLALGVMCAGFVILTMRKNAKEAKEFTIPVWGRFLLTAASLFALTYISLRQKSDTPIEANTLLIIGVLIAAVLVLGMLASLITSWEKQTAIHWGMFLGIVLVIALPILFTFIISNKLPAIISSVDFSTGTTQM